MFVYSELVYLWQKIMRLFGRFEYILIDFNNLL